MTDEPDWRALFGHEDPYDVQVDGIEAAIETAREGGYLAVEGACGTGKTMLALTAGVHLVRDPDTAFERVLVLTSVKQQLRQFEADLRAINDGLPDDWRPVSGVTLVGKADVCPYNRESAGGIDDDNVYDRCEGLRERTREAADRVTPASLAAEARSQQVGLADSATGGGADYLSTAGAAAPYPRTMPTTPEGDVEYCPFYAQYLEDRPEDGDPGDAVPFDLTDAGLLDPEDLVALSVEHGTCPHSMMGAVLGRAEVVVGNYYHAFDPTTVGSFTGALLDETTFVVCDEAHMLEPRVRELVSDGVADASLADAERELTRVIQPVRLAEGESRENEDAALVRQSLSESGVSLSELEDLRSFLDALREELDRRVRAHLEHEQPGWRADMTGLDDAELPLREPDEPGEDAITRWAREAGFDGRVWARAEAVGAVVGRILDDLEGEDTKRIAPGVGRALSAWHRAGHTDYFREIELERTWDDTAPTDSWRRCYNARLALHSCMPGDAIGERLAAFGGGVLMSATLAPMDVFRAVTGLDHLAAEGRPVATRTYGLTFPSANRESFAVAAPKFTYANRGDPDESTEVRRRYVEAVRQVARVEGNVLVGMPNYAEAEWMAGALDDLEAPVLLDESTDDAVTEAVKREFFAGPPKVLVTSLRGTLTEGVDYRGDRLRAAVVCGVPIINTASPLTTAVRTAYDRRFGDGFRDALAVPAVRKARQAVGRVIRGPEEVGVRVLLDERYARDSWDSVRDLLGPDREEFQPVSPDMLSVGLDRFTSRG